MSGLEIKSSILWTGAKALLCYAGEPVLSSPVLCPTQHQGALNYRHLQRCPMHFTGGESMNPGCYEDVVSCHSHTRITAWLSPFLFCLCPVTGRVTQLCSECARSGKVAENFYPFSIWGSCPPVDLSEVAQQGQSSTGELVVRSTWSATWAGAARGRWR